MTPSGADLPDTIPGVVASAAERFGPDLAIVDGDTRLTWVELFDRSRRFGAALLARGISPGDRVAIWAFNSVEWVVAFLGLSQAGAVLVPINTRFKGLEAADMLSRSRARALVTVTDFLGTDYVELLRGAGAELPDLETIAVARGPAREGTVPWDELLGAVSDGDLDALDRRRDEVRPDWESDILFTSGTTGVPKGVVMTHDRTLTVSKDWVAMAGLGPDDRYLMVNPYFHMFGLKAGILASVVGGALMLPEAVFDPTRALARVAEEGVTVFPGAPTVYQSILDHPDRDSYDLSTLRLAVTGAADIPVRLIERLYEETPFSTIITGYGLTEGGTATSTAPGDDPETVATTVGRARPSFELRVVGSDGADMPVGEAGEVVLRGRSVMKGYLDDPEATAQVLSEDGWLRTGDLGVLDERGYLRIVGRVKDMFIVGGFNAYPAEIENILMRHPDVQQAAVIGIPDERLGEVGMAYLVTRSGNREAAGEIIAWCRENMANYKVPRVVEIVDELPLNATGKVLKDELRARAAERSAASG